MQFKNKPSRIRDEEAFFGSWKGDRGRLKFFKGLKVGEAGADWLVGLFGRSPEGPVGLRAG